MNNQEKQDKIEVPWWRDGMIIFAKVSGYIAIPVILASFIGKYFDNKYNTGNLIFLSLTGIAFISTIYLIWREMKTYNNKLEKEEPEQIKSK